MKPCSECGGTLIRMYSKEYLDKHFPISYKDKMNMNIHIESKRLFECIECDHTHRLSDVEYGAYILSQFKGLKI